MRQFMDISRALADETRVRALVALRNRELCVCQVIALTELAPSTVSKHMTVLRQAGLVESSKRGRWVYYRLPDPGTDKCVDRALAWVFDALADSPQVKTDKRKLNVIACMDLEVLVRQIATR